MRRWVKFAAALLTASFAFTGVASAQDMKFFKIGTGGTGGTYYPIGGLIANAISNDGDALFPAIALTPRMAIIATLYSAIPALIISYFFLFTG